MSTRIGEILADSLCARLYRYRPALDRVFKQEILTERDLVSALARIVLNALLHFRAFHSICCRRSCTSANQTVRSLTVSLHRSNLTCGCSRIAAKEGALAPEDRELLPREAGGVVRVLVLLPARGF